MYLDTIPNTYTKDNIGKGCSVHVQGCNAHAILRRQLVSYRTVPSYDHVYDGQSQNTGVGAIFHDLPPYYLPRIQISQRMAATQSPTIK